MVFSLFTFQRVGSKETARGISAFPQNETSRLLLWTPSKMGLSSGSQTLECLLGKCLFRKTGVLNAEMTQFMETMIDELSEPMDVSDSQIFSEFCNGPIIALCSGQNVLHQDVSTSQRKRAFRSRMSSDVTCTIQQFVSPVVWKRFHRPGECRRRTEPTRRNEDGIGAGPARSRL